MHEAKIKKLKKAIRNIPDFPIKGILFRDITPILANPKLFKAAIDVLCARHKGKKIDAVAAVDARGFIFGGAVARALKTGFIPIRKKGKLPFTTIEESYQLEYGSATLTMHTDALKPGDSVLLLDDLLATGGTAAASAGLIEKLGARIEEIAFLIELASLKGREKIKQYPIFAAITFE
ncbi:MAG: adenine phosphoribosyltransferase [Verrucomicrobia bacterium]|nr:adenine phosphoribosyltransferase [Verrucomicrobiota bacterium]MCG2679723.1 adenine phosphoribosyltransferase [Kiritimatiellia bacterium]MBU4247569.1 adenine phosphoribosyltransferase [Verrucomicrobiota bacterium]MBU4290711.1 adenine phosphoribosyltransferase [Verrucomicrobiota bacterium]MBU4428795.1 adenine phosphoribosyltransferase [Verrucomicrobiota bacterium]